MRKSNFILERFIGVTITLVISVLIFSQFINTSSQSITTADKVVCQNFLKVKSSTAFKAFDFIYDVNLKCKKQELVIDSPNKEDIFREIATSMKNCYEMYGSGELNFESNFNERDYCFLCSQIEFENKDKAYSFEEYVNWTRENSFDEESSSTFYEDMNLKEGVRSDRDLLDMQMTIDELKEDSDLIDFAIMFSYQKNYIIDLINKEIDTNQKGYIVYRFDVLDEELKDSLKNTLYGVGVGIISEIVFSSIVKSGTSFAMCSLGSPILGVFCGTVSLTSSAFKGVFKAGKLAKASLKINKLSQITNKLVITSKSSKVLKQYSSLSNKYKLPKKGSVDDYLRKLEDLLNNKGGKGYVDRKEMEKLEEFYTLLSRSNKAGHLKGFSVSDLFKAKNFKYLMLGIVPGVSGTLASLYTDENLQYVEYLTQEEYFRKCGFNPYLNK